ncbi:MAG: DUF6787 family protein [Leeuwenhoekiella sp.]
MDNFKKNWEIKKNWQLIYPALGILLSLGSGLLIAYRILSKFDFISDGIFWVATAIAGIILTWVIIKICLFFFKKLKNRWVVDYRWEYIAIFIVFAITGSTAGRISDPVMGWLGLSDLPALAYWPLRILLIFPLYQILLIIVAWIFGQYSFFYAFEKKMLSRMGLGFLFSK